MHYLGMITSDDIKAARAFLNETQAQFAERFGVDQATVSRWETFGIADRGTTRVAIESVLRDLQPKVTP